MYSPSMQDRDLHAEFLAQLEEVRENLDGRIEESKRIREASEKAREESAATRERRTAAANRVKT